MVALKNNLSEAEEKLAQLKQAAGKEWLTFEAGVNAAITRLRKSLNKSTALRPPHLDNASDHHNSRSPIARQEIGSGQNSI